MTPKVNVKMRWFIATQTYNVNGYCGFISRGMVLEVWGSCINVYGYIRSPIKAYSKIDLTKWKEVRTHQDITEIDLQSLYIQGFLKHIPKTHY